MLTQEFAWAALLSMPGDSNVHLKPKRSFLTTRSTLVTLEQAGHIILYFQEQHCRESMPKTKPSQVQLKAQAHHPLA